MRYRRRRRWRLSTECEVIAPRSVSRKVVLAGFASALIAAAAIPLAAPQAVQASPEHPRLVIGGEPTKPGMKVPIFAWGQVRLTNAVLGTVECVNLFYGELHNETEPGGAGNNLDVRAYGEILQWSASGFITPAGTEPQAKCKDAQGLEIWATAERPLHVESTVGRFNLNGAATERLVAIGQPHDYTGPAGTFGLGHWHGRHPGELPFEEGSNGTGNYRERASTPWQVEAQGTENTLHEPFFFLLAGIARTERVDVEAEEARAETPTEDRTGCYPHPETEKLTLHPGYAEPTEEFTTLRPDPEGCVQVNMIAPEVGVEQTFQGTLEPVAVRGAHNCLSPSRAELRGTEERSGYHLESDFGPAFASTVIPIKECGFGNLELPQLR
jgi:hypothetical protein